MSKEIEQLKEYLQYKIDNGFHKLFYNDLDYDVKTIDCINAINELQQENQKLKEQLEKKYKEVGTLTNEILYEENIKLLSVLEEIREYFNPDKWDKKILIIDTVYNEINRILDMEKIND